MPQLRETFGDQPDIHLDLTADEYRLLAELLLDHMATDPVRGEQHSSLAQRLFVLAVQADRKLPQD